MKPVLMLSLVLSFFSGSAFAEELCGTIGSYRVAPVCLRGQMCPHWVRNQFDIVTKDGRKIDIQTSGEAILMQIERSEGSEVCLEGEFQGDAFEVSSVN